MKYGFENVIPSSHVDLNRYIADEEIIEHYFGSFEVGKYYTSPLRAPEKTPSFVFTYYQGALKWRDLGQSPAPFSAIQFVQKLIEYDTGFALSYFDTIRTIYNDLVLRMAKRGCPLPIKTTKDLLGTSFLKHKVGIRYREKYEPWEFDYWSILGVTQEELMNRYKVYPCQVWIDHKRVAVSRRNDPVYIYLFDKSLQIWKVYRPAQGKAAAKFLSNNIRNHIQGWDLLPESGEIVFITKSYKDVVVLDHMGYPACAPHNETIFLPEDKVVDLKRRFKYIYVNYDNDPTGVSKSREYVAKYDLRYWNVPKLYIGSKDPYDMVKNQGYDTLEESIQAKFKRDGISVSNTQSQ